MKILVKESIDKREREIVEISKSDLLSKIQDDFGYLEVIDLADNNSCIRVYFDIDSSTHYDVLPNLLPALCKYFQCDEKDWAISCGNRPEKMSYHILSRKFSMKIRNLRKVHSLFKKDFPCIDSTVLYYRIDDEAECGYLRFPNQSKDSINKPAPPMKILQGDISDFLVSDTELLSEFLIESTTQSHQHLPHSIPASPF